MKLASLHGSCRDVLVRLLTAHGVLRVAETVWLTVFVSLALGIIWIGSLTSCAKVPRCLGRLRSLRRLTCRCTPHRCHQAGLYGTIILSFVLQVALTVGYFTLGNKTLKLCVAVCSGWRSHGSAA